jgi:hypothetical protein
MKLLTIACNRDKKQLLMLAESISLFLEPCTHYIVINEENANIDKWKKLLKPYYRKHKLKFLTYDTSSYIPKWSNGMNHVGWHRHAILKILAFKDIQDDYLAVDSKHLFIKKTNLEDFSNYIGCNLFTHHTLLEEKRLPTFNYYKKIFGYYPEYVCHDEMPFLFKKDVLSKIKNIDQTAQWLADIPVMILEPTYYSFLIAEDLKNALDCKSKHFGFWNHNYEFIELEPNKQIIAFHRLYLEKIDKNIKQEINNFLSSLGFKNLFEY